MCAEIAPRLFEDYSYGMAKSQVLAKTKTVPCKPPHPLALCAATPVEFLRLKWQEKLWFNNEDKLQQIMLLYEDPAPDLFTKLAIELKKAGWLPIYFESEGRALDMVEQNRLHGAAGLDRIEEEFVQDGLESENGLTISFFPKQFVENALKDAEITSWSQAVDQASEDLRMLNLKTDKNNIVISFTIPLLSRKNALRYGQIIRR